MLLEHAFVREGCGTVNVVGTPSDGVVLRVKDIDFGEFVDLEGHAHGPLTAMQCIALLRFADTEAEALALIAMTEKESA